MTANLVEVAKSYLSHDVVSQLSRQFGETEQNTQTALDGAIPTLLGGLIQKSSRPGGSSSVMDLVAEVTTPDRSAGEVVEPVGGIPGQLGQLLGGTGGQLSHVLATGSGIVSSVFGNQAEAITGALASHSGIKPASASSLLNLAGPVLLSVLGQKMAADDLGVSSMADLLSSQSSYARAATPSGLSSLLGGPSGPPTPAGLSGGLSLNGRSAETSAEDAGRKSIESASPMSNFAYNDDMSDMEGGNRWLPWLMLALGAIALVFILRSCTTDQTGT